MKKLLGRAWQDWREPAVIGALLAYPAALAMVLVLIQTPSADLAMRFLFGMGYNLLVSFALAGIIFCLPYASLRVATGTAVVAMLALYTFAQLYHYLLYSQLFGVSAIYVLIDSSLSEGLEFAGAVSRTDFLALAVLGTLPMLLAWRRMRTAVRSVPRQPPYQLAFYLLLVGASAVASTERPNIYGHNPLQFLAASVEEALSQKKIIKEAYAKMAAELDTQVLSFDSQPATHILVIGESTTSKRMSLYGYGRRTTPRLDAMRKELLVAQDACSSRGNTLESIKELLTFATRDNPELVFQGPNIVQLMNAAGYSTYWLSNQQLIGRSDSWSEILSSAASERKFINLRGWRDGISWDGALLPPFKDIMADGNSRRFIVIHLLGAHAAYSLRYPPEFDHFTGLDGLDERIQAKSDGTGKRWLTSLLAQNNSYDNAVLYTDYIVASVMALARQSERFSVTFISDHGESLGESSSFTGHLDGPAPRQVYEVPLVFFLSESLRESLPDRIATLSSNLAAPFQSDMLLHTLADLYSVRHELVQPSRSLFNNAYRPPARYCDQLQ